MTRHVVLYCRLSPRPDGSYEGVDLQEKWGREYAASAWPDLPVEVFADSGISAANGDRRPEYERLREWLAAGKVAQVWTVEQTRLERREVEWFTLAAELDAAGVTELHTNRDGVVRVRDEVAGIKAVLAAGEVRKLKRRINDRLGEIAANGEPPGSRPFGYRHAVNADGVRTYEAVPEQAAAVRDAAEMLLAGWSLSAIAAELAGRGIVGAHGGKVTGYTVRGMVSNPTAAGLRVHRGRVIGSGNWPPILSEETWHAVKNKLAAPRVVKRSDGGTYPISAKPQPRKGTGRRYLLTGGTAVCGVCETSLVASVKQLKNGKRKPYYLCHPGKGGGGCVGIIAEGFETHVVAELLDELDKPAFRDALADDEHQQRRDGIVAALRKVDADKGDLAEMWGAGELTAEEWRTAKRALAEREQELRADLTAVPPPVSHIDPAMIRSGWDAMTLDEQREIVSMFVERVTVKRATLGFQGFDSRRVEITWRTA